MNTILGANAGSSSVKFQVCRWLSGTVSCMAARRSTDRR
jgi:hypothetical protein